MKIDGVEVAPAALLACSNAMRELAAELHAGRPESDLLELTRPPNGHRDVDLALRKFAELALPNYRVATATVAAIATRVGVAAYAYKESDAAVADSIRKLLANSHIIQK